MSRSRKRAAAEEEESDEQVDEDEEELWGEEDDDDAPTAKPARKKTKQIALIEDVVGGDDAVSGVGGEDDLSDGYDSELYGDDADRTYLDSLPELEREKIIFQRAEKRQELEERREAKRRAAAAGGGAGQTPLAAVTRGRTRSSGGGVSTRGKAGSGGPGLPDALADLIARRKNKTTGRQTDSVVLEEVEGEDEMKDEEDIRERRGRGRKARQRRQQQAEETDDDEEKAGDDGRKADTQRDRQQDEEERERRRQDARFSIPGSRTALRLSDMKLLQLRRDRLERVHDEPYFADVVKGMFVRVTVGQDATRGVAKYRVGEVVEVGELKAKYPFPPGTARSTRVALLLQRGEARRLFAMSAVSNQSITEDEFNDYVAESRKTGQSVPTAEEALERRKRVEYVKESYVYTPELVNKMLEEKKGSRARQLNVTIERTKLDIEMQRAKAAVEQLRQRLRTAGGSSREEAEAELRREESRLESVENRLAELQELELKAQAQHRSRSDVADITTVNRKNAERDISTARDMFIQQEREKREEEERLRREGRKREIVLDPFKRRATRPSSNFDDDDGREEQKQQQDAGQKQEESKQQLSLTADDGDDAAQTQSSSSQPSFPSLPLPPAAASASLPPVIPAAGAGTGLLSFPHPPSLSELMLRQLELSHQEAGVEVDLQQQPAAKGGGEADGATGRAGAGGCSLYGGRLWSSDNSVLRHNERVLSVSEYWARRDLQADRDNALV